MSAISWVHSATGATLYYVLRQPGLRWNDAAMVAYVVANWTSYQIAMPESPAGGYEYAAAVPAGLPPGWYYADIYAGVTNTPGDALVADQYGYWNGTTYDIAGTAVNVLPAITGSIGGGIPTGLLPNAEQYCPYSVTIPIFDATGSPIDLSMVPLAMDFWDPNAGPDLVEAFTAKTSGTVHATLTVSGPSQNQVTLAVDATLTTEAIKYAWRLRPNDNSLEPYMHGTWAIDPGPPIV